MTLPFKTLFEPALLEPARRESIRWQVPYFVVWVAVTAIGFWLHPDPTGHGTHQQLGLPPCPSALFFDRPCPGCGLTTSWTALLHGQWRFAFESHPLGPVLYVGYTMSALLAGYGYLTKRALVTNSIPVSRFLTACAVLFLAFGMYRMATTPHFRTPRETRLVMGLARE
jgi:hypothetical protein